MTATAQRDAILRVGIVFHIVNVMNAFAALAANSAGVIVALSNHALESIVERGRVWLEGKPAAPVVAILALGIDTITFVRTKTVVVSFGLRKLLCVFLPAVFTDKLYALSPRRVMTFFRAIFASLVSRIYKKLFVAMRTSYGFLAAFPKLRFLATIRIRGRTSPRAKPCNLFMNLENIVSFTTIQACSPEFAASPSGRFITNQVGGLPFALAFHGAKASVGATVGMHKKSLLARLADYLDLGLAVRIWHLVSKRSTPYAARAFAHTARA